jgi:hypothetical protein
MRSTKAIGVIIGSLLLIVGTRFMLQETTASLVSAQGSNKLEAATDGTLPWSKNSQQNRLGPTSAWTDQKSHIGVICNGTWCWQLNFSSNKLENSGNPTSLRSGSVSGGISAPDNALFWADGGPTSGWEEYKNSLVSISNGKNMWLWTNSGLASYKPIDLSTQDYWKDTVAAADGTTLFSGKGITAAWTDKANSREYFCNTKWCWVFNYEELRWHNQDSSSKGRPFDITSLFKVAPSSTGISLTTNAGPTVGWTNDVSNTSVICNEGFCWSYKNKSGSRPDLLDVTWDRADGQNLGQAVTICEALGQEKSICTGEQPPVVPPPAPPAPPVVPPPIPPIIPPTPPQITPEISCKAATGDQATFTWKHHELAKKYILRIDRYNSCKNDTNETIYWFCGTNEGFPNNTGDQYYLLNATGQDGVCTNGICSITKPVVANAQYTNASIQWVLADNVTTADVTRMGNSAEFSCTGADTNQPLKGDFDKNNGVDIFDYNLLYSQLEKTNCEFNLVGSSCAIDYQDLLDFRKLFGSAMARIN